MPSTTFIDTNTLPRVKTPQGEVTEILNHHLAGAKNVLGMLHWLKSGETFQPEITPKHQLIYLMEGKANINLESKDYEVARGAGVYLGPSETAIIRAADGATAKLFHLVVPQIPR
jgi:quercetin dioxygenase-like cupin family protein